jgi:hypothetical protein
VAVSCKHVYELSGSIKDGEFLDYLSSYRLFKKDSATWSQFTSLEYNHN